MGTAVHVLMVRQVLILAQYSQVYLPYDTRYTPHMSYGLERETKYQYGSYLIIRFWAIHTPYGNLRMVWNGPKSFLIFACRDVKHKWR
jgi:hypothetical protein